MNFDKHSNFNPKANFSEVKFGENMPVLEVELNEMQQIQNEARADIIRDSIPSGFVTLGEIDYEYCKSNDNQIKLKTESIAYVNGYRITIPKDTIIEIGESDKVREDLVFLEVWKEVVTDESDLKEYGGEQNADIENPIKDERYPIATSQRVALKYRIRHVADLNFNYSYSSATSSNLHPYIGWNGDKNFSPVYAMGGNNSLECPKQILGEEIFRSANKEWRYVAINDSGLWIAGLPETDERCTKERYKSIDGFVYAIPMFRLKRKPNVGLASPFEYKKIHTQIDPKKFAHLVNQENVEKVHSVDVVGKTYTNLLTYASTLGNGATNVTISPEKVTFNTTTAWGKVGFLINGQPNTKYIFHCADFFTNGINKWVQFYVRYSSNIHEGTGTLTKIDENTYTFTTDTTGIILFTFEIPAEITGAFVDSPIIMKYSEWNDELRGKTIVGMQSLGQEQCNSITIENNLVKEGVYVPELQNHILPTHPEVTHVSWGEDVVIPPEVEIELKRGEEVIQTITQLPARLETTGEEKLHVKTMKGRTWVNVNSCYTDNDFIMFNNATIDSDGWITITANGDFLNVFPRMNNLIKPNTKYLAIIEVKENTLDGKFRPFTNWGEDTCFTTNFQDMNNSNSWAINENAKGVFKSFLTTKDDIADAIVLERSYVDVSCTTGSITYRTMLIEYQQDMENWDIPFFRGMQSVEEPNIRVVGKNLYTHQKAEVQGINKQDIVVYVPVSPNTTYTFDASAKSWATVTLFNTGGSETRVLGGVKDSKIVTFTTDSSEVSAQLTFYHGDNTNIRDVDFEKLQIQFVEGSDIPSYELGKLNELRTPKNTVLRSIPHQNIFDSIDFNKGTINSYIDEVVFDGSSDEVWQMNTNNDGTSKRFDYNNLKYKLPYVDSNEMPPLLCNHLLPVNFNTIYSNRGYGVGLYYNNSIVINNGLTQLETLKAQMSQNPIIVQYKKKNPTTTLLYLSEDDYVGKSKVTYQLAEPLHKVGTYSDFIKGNTLFSNIGVEVLNGSEEWVRQTGTDYGFYVSHPNSMPSTPLISPQLPTLNGWEGYARKGIFRGSGAIGLVVSAGDLSENTLQGFKNWLQDNPVTIYYVKANPMEIPLKEVSPLECDFSLYRQFDSKYTGYPKELPNGVRDVVIGKGIIKRYTRHLTFNGTESWNALSTDGDVVRAFVNVTTSENLKPKAISEVLNSYKLPFGTSSITREEIGVDQNSNIVLALAKSRLSSADLSGFKNYLGQNPIQVILEVNSPYQNTVTEDKCKPIPYMPLNSYVGSLYVADGINQTKFLTAFSPSEYEVQTYHRYFSNEFNVFEDIKRKKSPYGHKTYLEEVEGKYVEKFIAGLEKHEIEDLRHKVSLTGFDYNHLLQDSFLKLIKGELS